MQGKGSDPGFANQMILELKKSLEMKRYENPNFKYELKVKYYEIVEE